MDSKDIVAQIALKCDFRTVIVLSQLNKNFYEVVGIKFFHLLIRFLRPKAFGNYITIQNLHFHVSWSMMEYTTYLPV